MYKPAVMIMNRWRGFDSGSVEDVTLDSNTPFAFKTILVLRENYRENAVLIKFQYSNIPIFY